MKITLYLIVFVFLSSALYGQSINSYGIKIGLSSASQKFEYSSLIEDKEFAYRNGIYIGAFVELMESEYFSLLIDLSYNQKGMIDEIGFNKVANNDDGFISEMKKFDNRLDYLTIGANVKSRYDFMSFTPYVLTGIKYDILTGKKINYSLGGIIEGFDIYGDVYDKYDGNIFGLTIGVGIEFEKLIDVPILIEWIYNHDLNKIRINKNLEIQNFSNEIIIGLKF